MEVRRVPRIILDGDAESASHMAREGMRQLNILKSSMGFNNLQQDIRKVEYIDGSRIVCRSCFGEDVVYLYAVKEEEEKRLPKFYVYVTISNYVTIWDLLTGEVATDICNNDGKVYDYYGESLITFPCHKSELVKWLEGIKDRPTRQVLKEEPEDNRDYLPDNCKDMGEENRVEKPHPLDPSYNLYYGVKNGVGPCCSFENQVYTEVDGCDPECCDCPNPANPCTVPNLEGCVIVYKTMHDTIIGGCVEGDPEKCKDSFRCESFTQRLYNCWMHYVPYTYYRFCRTCICGLDTDNDVLYLQTFFNGSKHLYLCSYPSPIYTVPPADIEVPYCIPECSCYENPLDFNSDCTIYNCKQDTMRLYGFYLRRLAKNGQTLTVKTAVGDLLLDYTPYRKWEGGPMLYEVMRDAVNEVECFAANIPEGIFSSMSDFEQEGYYWDVHGLICGEPAHATETQAWGMEDEQEVVADTFASESNRLAVSWCGSRYNYRLPPEEQTAGWYRVLLRFYMGKFFSSGSEGFYPLPFEHEWSNRATCERFSSVQATIELEHPENYPKDRTATVGDGESLRYKRPDDYADHPEDFTSLCAFPDRDCGYPEDEENNTCYPFDGTYDIYTLGEAIEKLVNSHYEDGSNDPLLVYLYERPNMRQQSTG